MPAGRAEWRRDMRVRGAFHSAARPFGVLALNRLDTEWCNASRVPLDGGICLDRRDHLPDD